MELKPEIKWECCEGWDKRPGHKADGVIKYRKEAELYLCDDCYKDFLKS